MVRGDDRRRAVLDGERGVLRSQNPLDDHRQRGNRAEPVDIVPGEIRVPHVGYVTGEGRASFVARFVPLGVRCRKVLQAQVRRHTQTIAAVTLPLTGQGRVDR